VTARLALPANPRILVVALRRLGDVLLTTPLVRSLRRAWPDARIDMLVFADTAPILAGNPDVDAVIEVPQRPTSSESRRLAAALWRRYDLAISTQPGDRPTAFALIAGRRSAGMIDDNLNGRIKAMLLGRHVVSRGDLHRVEETLQLAQALGIAPLREIVAPHADKPSDLQPTEDYAVLHAAPFFRYKQWRKEGWRALAAHLSRNGLRVVATGGPAPQERAYLDEVFEGTGVARADTTLVSIQTPRGAKQAFILIKPDKPVASVILFAGGHGALGLKSASSMSWGAGNFLVRSRDKEEWIITPRNYKLTLINDSRYVERSPKMTYLRAIDGSSIYFSENRLDIYPEYIIEHLATGGLWKLDLNGVIIDRQVQPEGFIEKIFIETEGLRGIKKNGQYGFVDSQGRLRIANRYDDIQPFQEELAAVKIRNKWGFINHEDKIAIQHGYEEVSLFKNGFSLVKQKGLYGLINKKGTQILQPRYEFVAVLPHGNLIIQQDKMFGLANAEGRILINPKYHTLEDLNNNYVIVERDGKFGVVTVQGISTVPLIYDHIAYDGFNNAFIALKKSEWRELKL
jgi:heptosyltransferase-3